MDVIKDDKETGLTQLLTLNSTTNERLREGVDCTAWLVTGYIKSEHRQGA
jgi:hypothetical protein